MSYKKRMLIGIVCVLTACAVTQRVCAKSVFAVASHETSQIKAYKIYADHIDRQDTVEGTEDFGIGACGLCVWASQELMFVTYESSGVIAWASTKTLERNPQEDEFNTGITDTDGLAGIVAYQSILYVITRDYGRLYTYTYDEEENTLILIHPDDPVYPNRKYRVLEGVNKGYGLALDQGSTHMSFPVPRLFAADGTGTVRYFNTVTWQLEGSVNMGRPTIGIDVDGSGRLYGGGHWNHNYLMRYDFNCEQNDPNRLLEKDMGAGITDTSIDRDTGLLYTTTRRCSGDYKGTVEVYDPTNWVSTNPDSLILLDQETDDDFVVKGPAGIAVGPQYKPPNMYIDKKDDIDQGVCVVPDDYITYTLCYRPGQEDEYNVVVTDYLPNGVSFVDADPCENGYYTPQPSHTYTWEIGFVPGGEPNQCLELTVQVNDRANPLGVLKNIVEIESDESYTNAKEYTNVCCWEDPCSVSGVIYVNSALEPNVPGGSWNTGASWEDAYINLQSALRRAGECGSEIWVAWGIYAPGDDVTDSFEIPDNVDVYGGFKGNETNRDQRDFARYKTTLTGYIDGIDDNEKVVTMGNETVLDGFIIQSGFDGVNSENNDFLIANCSITNNAFYGVYSKNGDVTVS